MGKFILGVIVTVLVIILCGLGFAMLGYFPTPQRCTASMGTSLGQHRCRRVYGAPRSSHHQSYPPTDQNLEDGMKLYSMNCALCHGDLDRKPASLSKSFYPPAPNLVSDPPDDPEWHVFYTIRTGVRYTGMPSWEKTLSEQDMWKIASLLSHMEKLPPAFRITGKLPLAWPHQPARKANRSTKHTNHVAGESASKSRRGHRKKAGTIISANDLPDRVSYYVVLSGLPSPRTGFWSDPLQSSWEKCVLQSDSPCVRCSR